MPTVTRYGYRQARITGHVVSFSFKTDDAIDVWRQHLASITEGGPDNHETYLVKHDNGTALSVRFSDWHAHIGTGVLVESW